MIRLLFVALTWLTLTAWPSTSAEFKCLSQTTVGRVASSESLPDGSYKSVVPSTNLEGALAYIAQTPAGARRSIDTTAANDLWRDFFSRVGNTRCSTIYMSGHIVPGDFDKFRRMIARPNFVDRLYLASPGGDVAEAIRIGELVRELFIVTHVPVWNDFLAGPYGDAASVLHSPGLRPYLCSGEHCICASACVLVWAGGVDRWGDVIGLHRPSFDEQAFGQISATEAQALYQRTILSIERHLQRMEVPSRTVSAFLGTDSLRLVIPPRDYPELLEAAWGSDYPVSMQEWSSLYCPRTPKPQSRSERAGHSRRVNELPSSSAESECQHRLFFAERARRYMQYWRR